MAGPPRYRMANFECSPAPAPRASGGTRLGSDPARCHRGFTLVETMVVVLIISVLAMAAVPALKRSKRKALTAALANDLRVFAAAFDAYAQEMGTWPAESGAGVIPSGMAGRLPAAMWTKVSPVGGRYNWDRNRTHYGVRYAAAIVVSATGPAPLRLDADQLIDVDRTIDDGNLASGTFRLGAGNIPLYVVQQ